MRHRKNAVETNVEKVKVERLPVLRPLALAIALHTKNFFWANSMTAQIREAYVQNRSLKEELSYDETSDILEIFVGSGPLICIAIA